MEFSEVERRADEVAGFLRQEVQAAPYRTLGLALAAGYVLGGGLTPRAVRLLVVTGGRAMAGNVLAAAVRGAFDHRRMYQ
jgi:hypothetical protein